MSNFEKTPLIDLAHRLNQIRVERQNLDIEYNQIIEELWKRIPNLKEDPNMQLKKVKRLDNVPSGHIKK